MQISVTTENAVAVVAAVGAMETQDALSFERTLVEVLDAHTQQIVVDFRQVDLITSAGIRVLVMLEQRLRGHGSLVVCGLNDGVKSVFDVAGLAGYFQVSETVQGAIARLTADRASRAPRVGPSRLARLMLRQLGGDSEPLPAAPADARPLSRLSRQVARILAPAEATPARGPAPGPSAAASAAPRTDA